MSRSEITPDTQSVLLLTARFATRSDTAREPLTHREFNHLAIALGAAGLRPADLLTDVGEAFVADTNAHDIDPRRLAELLHRSMALAMQTEAWMNAGFWVMSRADDSYPSRLLDRLKARAPVVLFGCGNPLLLECGGLSIVGSRNVDEAGAEFTREIAAQAASEDIQVVSGGARGVDSIAMQSALDRGGSVVGVLANDLAKTSRSAAVREAIADERLCLVSPFQPESRFEAWKAMDRNKSIYALSDWALVVATDLRKGGTWAGAKENLDAGWVPLFVRTGAGAHKGNAALADMGASTLGPDRTENLRTTLEASSIVAREAGATDDDGPEPPQMTLF